MLPFREITLEDKPMVEHCGSHYNYHLCERCFVDLFMWCSHYNTQICFKDGFMLVKMSPLDGGHDVLSCTCRSGRPRRCAGCARAGCR